MNLKSLESCFKTIKKLRDPEKGCPWDLKQTHESLLKYLIEESYEFIEANHEKDDEKIKDELGDILLQVFLHSVIAEQRKAFTIEDVAKNLEEKMIRRHPHVFASQSEGISISEVEKNWETIKDKEHSSTAKTFLKDKLLHAPALTSSFKIGEKTNEVNFDWESYTEVLYKVEEEWQEVKEELPIGGKYNLARVEEEIGDLLFSIAQLARHLKIDPESALVKANRKFITRFRKMESLKPASEFHHLSQQDMEELWNQAKKK